MKVPANTGMDVTELGGIVEVYLTAYQLLKYTARVEVGSGKKILLWAGASGVGTSLIQLSKMMGLEPIAVASSDEKLDKCRELGAAHTLNYKSLTSDDFV